MLAAHPGGAADRGRPPRPGRRRASCTRSLGGGERWAATRSVAKALGPDLRLAVLAGDRADDRARAGAPAVRAGLGQPHPAALVLELWSDPAVERAGRRRASATYARAPPRAARAPRRAAASSAHGASGPERVGPGRRGRRGASASLLAARLGRGPRRALPARPPARPAIRVTTATLAEPEAERLAGDLAEVLAPSGAQPQRIAP